MKIKRELVFSAISHLGWTVEMDVSGTYFPEVPAVCDAGKRIIWVNDSATIEDQVRAALYLSLWPDAFRVDFRPDADRSMYDFRSFVIDAILLGIFAGAAAAKAENEVTA